MDEILLAVEDIEEVAKLLKDEFNIREVEKLENFIGLEIIRGTDKLLIHQKNMINKTLKIFGNQLSS